jgi:hypothetical protein
MSFAIAIITEVSPSQACFGAVSDSKIAAIFFGRKKPWRRRHDRKIMGHRKFARGHGQRIDVAAVAVDDQQAGKAQRAQRAHDAFEDGAIGGVVDADGAAERQMMLAQAEPQAGQHGDRHGIRPIGDQSRRGDRRRTGARGIGDDRQMRAMLFQRSGGQDRQRSLARRDLAQLRRGHAGPFDFHAHDDLPRELDGERLAWSRRGGPKRPDTKHRKQPHAK